MNDHISNDPLVETETGTVFDSGIPADIEALLAETGEGIFVQDEDFSTDTDLGTPEGETIH